MNRDNREPRRPGSPRRGSSLRRDSSRGQRRPPSPRRRPDSPLNTRERDSDRIDRRSGHRPRRHDADDRHHREPTYETAATGSSWTNRHKLKREEIAIFDPGFLVVLGQA